MITLKLGDSCVPDDKELYTVVCTLTQTVISNIWSDPGFTAIDNVEGAYPIERVTVQGWPALGESKLGQIDLSLEKIDTPYTITYDVADGSVNKNQAIQMTRKVYVLPPCEVTEKCKPKLCKALSTATEIVCETCDASGNTFCLVEQEVREVADLRPPIITTERQLKVNDGPDKRYSFRSTDESGKEMVVNYVEQGQTFIDPGASAVEIVTSTDQKTQDVTNTTSDISGDITTKIIGNKDTELLQPGVFFRYKYEITQTDGTILSAIRPVIILNPCVTTKTGSFGDIIGSKAVPMYKGPDGKDKEERLCEDAELELKTGVKRYKSTAACSINGLCIGLEETQVDEVEEKPNEPPVVKLYGANVVEILAGQAWQICLPGSSADALCDRGIDEALSFDPEQGKITNKLIKVCAGEDGKGGAIFADSHESIKGGQSLSRVCGFNTNNPGTFTVDYSFFDNEGLSSRVFRQVIVKPDCTKLRAGNGEPEFLCENKVLDENGLEAYVCSVNNYCVGDLVETVVELVESPPVIELNVVPGVVDKTVNVRKYQPYKPCEVNPATGEMILPENTFFGDGLCDPGVTAYDIKQERGQGGEILEVRKNLTTEVLSCPPIECQSLEKCDDHLYTNKGLDGCIDTNVEGEVQIEFTIRDDASQISKVYRTINVIGPCPIGYEYCPGVQEDQACQLEEVCQNAAALAAAAAATEEVADTEAPKFTRFVPKSAIMLEYGIDYVGTRTPFKPCYDADDRLTANDMLARGTANATEYPCAMRATDNQEGEVSQYIQVTQVITGSESFFAIDQHGTGVIPPGQYTYQYTVSDLAGNDATETLIINVVLRKFVLLPDIAINRTLFEENNFQKNFKESFAKDLIDYGLPENVIFNGYEDLELLNITDSGTDKKFTVKVTYFELPAGVNANGTPSSSSRRRRLLANTIAGGATSGVSSSLSSAATASSGTNQTINVTASATEGSDSPTVDMDAAVLASIAGEISVISNQISASMAGLDDMITAVAASGGNPSAYKQRIADYWKSLLVAADETTKGLQSQAEETLRVLDATISVQQEALNSVLELEVLLKKQADELKAALDALGEDTNNELGKACQFRSNIGGAEIFFNVTKYSPLGMPPPAPAPPPSPPMPPPPPPSPPAPSPPPSSGRRLLEVTEDEERLHHLVAGLLEVSDDMEIDQFGDQHHESGRRHLLATPSSGSSPSAGWTAAKSSVTDWKGYDVLQGGPSEQYKAPKSYIGRRFVSNTNRMVGGLLIHQVRSEFSECEGTKFKHIASSCRSDEPSVKPFGVDPVFRRPEAGQGTLESLYNVKLEDFVGDYYNTSQASGSLRASTSEKGGVPYGFIHREVPGYQPGFPVYIDIAATRGHVANLIQYLKEGLFFDASTRSVTAQAVTYNPNLRQLANVMVIFNFTEAGDLSVSHKITNMNVKWYTEWNDQNNDGLNDGLVQLTLEIILVGMITYAASLELREFVSVCMDERSVLAGMQVHFANFWNFLDAVNITLQVISIIVWINYQFQRRQNLEPLLRYNVYDNPAQPMANYFMPQKSGDLTATAADENLNRTGISDAADTTGGFRWQLPNDDAGIKLLGESMSTVQELSSLLTFYFCVTGMSLLVMIARSLKLVDFQRHLDLTVRTLSRSSLDLLHFIIIFFITLLLSMMMGHLMVGPTEESLSRLDLAFNLHFEFILGSSLDILAKLFTDRSIVRSEIEYAALVIYSFGVPIFLLFILVNLILGIVGDSFGEEKENLGELNEPTLLDDFISTVAYRYGRFRGKYPSYTELVRLLKSVRSSKMSKAQEVLAKGLGTVDSLAPTGDGKKIGAGAAKKKFTGPVTEQKIPGNAVTSGSGHGKKINPKADKDQDFDEMAHIERVINGVNTPEQSARARSRWALFKAKGLRANILLRALGVDLNDLRRKDPMEQLALAEKQGIGLLVDVMSKTEDVDSDSDSSVDEDTKARRHHQRAVRGEARATAWDAVKAYSNPPQVNPNDNDWQSLMDDSWNEFMSNVKDKQARKTSARMFRLRGLGLFTEAEVTQWLLDADDSAQKNG